MEMPIIPYYSPDNCLRAKRRALMKKVKIGGEAPHLIDGAYEVYPMESCGFCGSYNRRDAIYVVNGQIAVKLVDESGFCSQEN